MGIQSSSKQFGLYSWCKHSLAGSRLWTKFLLAVKLGQITGTLAVPVPFLLAVKFGQITGTLAVPVPSGSTVWPATEHSGNSESSSMSNLIHSGNTKNSA